MNKEYILCAAVWIKDGIKHEHQPINIETGFVVCGRRHHNCFAVIASIGETLLKIKGEKSIKKSIQMEREIQGFITNKDRFVDRKEGGKIAFDSKQINKETDLLFSEDLY